MALITGSALAYRQGLEAIRVGKAVLGEMVWSPAPETDDGR